MGRVQTQTLKLSAEERTWLQERFAREAYKISGLTEKERKERLPQKILSIKKKLDDPGSEKLTVDRNDVRILEQQTANYVTLMRTKTLPEYEKRINQGGDAVTHYTPYRNKELARVEMLEDLLTRLEGMSKK
jgi:hypothetical protein